MQEGADAFDLGLIVGRDIGDNRIDVSLDALPLNDRVDAVSHQAFSNFSVALVAAVRKQRRFENKRRRLRTIHIRSFLIPSPSRGLDIEFRGCAGRN